MVYMYVFVSHTVYSQAVNNQEYYVRLLNTCNLVISTKLKM